jgi:glycosyltransferase involved in cell wall biosynthesis
MPLLKILFLQDRPQIQGGALRYMRALLGYLEERGHACRILGFTEAGTAAAGDVIQVPRKTRGAIARKAVAKLDWDFRLYRQLRAAFGRLRPEVIHLHNFLAGGNAVLAACSGIPTVHTVHDLGLLCPRSGRGLDARGDLCSAHFGLGCVRRGCASFRVFVEHALLRESVRRIGLHIQVDRVIVHSLFLAERLRAYGLRPLRLPRFVDTQTFPFVPAKEGCRQVLFVGYLDEPKGLGPLLEAFRRVLRRVPGARLDIVGDGPRKGEYVRSSADMGESVCFHGEVRHEDVPAFYQGSALVAVPSQIPETGPFAALEAMSTGRPVVGSRLGGLAEIVEEGRTGHLVDRTDVEGLADRIARLLREPAEAARMGLRARARAERMSRENPFPRIESLYRQLVERRGGGPRRSSDP